MEKWRKIEGNYSVSDLGNVRNDKTGHTLSKISDPDGYHQVRMYVGKPVTRKVHRLVAIAFQEICGEYKEGLQVDHINTIRNDNRAENLRWVTPKENSNNELSKQNMSNALKGRFINDEWKHKMSVAHYKRWDRIKNG